MQHPRGDAGPWRHLGFNRAVARIYESEPMTLSSVSRRPMTPSAPPSFEIRSFAPLVQLIAVANDAASGRKLLARAGRLTGLSPTAALAASEDKASALVEDSRDIAGAD